MPQGRRPLQRLCAVALLAGVLALWRAAAVGLEVEVFTRAGCPRCAAAESFIADLHRQRPDVVVVEHRVDTDPDAARRLRDLASERGAVPVGVPAFLVRGELLIGFQSADTTGTRVTALLDRPAAGPGTQASGEACGPEEATACTLPAPAAIDRVVLPWIGSVEVKRLGLPGFTIVIGLLDGFNPCAMWVLLFLLSLLVNLGNRGRMVVIAGTFVLVSGLAYFAFMAAWLNVFLLMGWSRVTQVSLGGVAALVGAINIKDFFAFRRGISLGIPASAKPGIYTRVRRIVYADDLLGAIVAAAVLAVLVNSIELLCTAGFPAVYTQILTMRGLPMWKYFAYLAIYNAAYMFDDTVMLTIAVVTLGRYKLQERAGRWLKLVSGLAMLGLAYALVMHPEWLAA